jgi:predicted RNA methylase
MSVTALEQLYDDQFYAEQVAGSVRSARLVLGRLFEVYQPHSVADFGCGRGSWLMVAESLGSKVLHGYDGTWIDPDQLLSKNIAFHAVTMEQEVALEQKHDLCMSLEVAEHLSESRAAPFVDTLCRASDVVLFSAAVRHQGGMNHINENWQSYWAQLFYANGYHCFDIFRGALWNNAQIEWWYRQNLLLFVNGKTATPVIPFDTLARMQQPILDAVHPENYEDKIRWVRQPTFRFCLGNIKRYTLGKLGIGRTVSNYATEPRRHFGTSAPVREGASIASVERSA